MKYVLPLIMLVSCVHAQSEIAKYQENRWIINSGINLPAIKFHIADPALEEESKGYVELFSSFGVGLGLNYGKAKFTRDALTLRINEEEVQFSNLFGFQIGVLYSSKVNDNAESDNIDYFSVYTGLNILDLQLGVGKELGARYRNSNGWFLSVSYEIPIYKLTGKGSYIIKSKTDPKQKKVDLVSNQN